MPEPSGNERDQAMSPAGVPTAISDEPPPTSTTAIVPSSGSTNVCVAPTNASRASSCSSRISTSTPASSRMPVQNASPLLQLRIACVATARSACAPSRSAAARCSATTAATSAIFGAAIAGSARRQLPMRVNDLR